MEEAMRLCGSVGGFQELIALCSRKCRAALENCVRQRRKEWRPRPQIGSKPSGAPQVRDAFPLRESAPGIRQCTEGPFLRTYLVGRVVGLGRQRKTNRQHVAKRLADFQVCEQRKRL